MGRLILWLIFASSLSAHGQTMHRHESASADQDMRTALAKSSALKWTDAPLLLPARAKHGERSRAELVLAGIAAPKVEVFAAAGEEARRRVAYEVAQGRVRIESASPKIGNYHWLVAREEHVDEVRVASTAWYFSNPGESPQRLLAQAKHELEIVPDPLPREHASYRESEKWRFLVRFLGQPLAGASVRLDTEFGSHVRFVADGEGRVIITFPRDFRTIAEEGRSRHAPRRANFVLSVAHEADGRRYLTAFNHVYGEDPDRQRSLAWGALFLCVGMALGVPLLRTSRPSSKQGENNV
ncbi:MAG: DUF4198 domain-containing protein [Rhodocyclaceae bacterium]|nr:DUF4198 domain-containing protein [Rhodocyclaceae bacterium]